MAREAKVAPQEISTLDDVAAGLEKMRLHSGAISFSELANLVQGQREAKGLSPAAARIPRSTIYDALRPGRRRIDPVLVEEIVLALGAGEGEAASWRRVCVEVMSGKRVTFTHPKGAADLTVTPDFGIPDPKATELPTTEYEEQNLAAAAAAAASASPPHPQHPLRKPQFFPAKVGTTTVLMVFILGIFINVFAHVPVDPLGLPIYLDMIGTAVAAIMLGPWVGAAVGLTSNLFASTVIMDWPGFWFALVNAAGGVLWGIGFHRWRMRTPLKFLLLNVIVAIGCTLVAVPVLVFVFGGSSGTSQDTLIPVAELLGRELWAAVFSSNMLTSLADKVLSGLIAIGVCQVLWSVLRHRSRREESEPTE